MSAISKTLLIAALAAVTMPAASFAADMVVYGQHQPSGHGDHYQSHRAENTYSNRAEIRCSENIVSYQAPYQRHTELVTLCHPPLNWRTEPSTATIWSP